MVVFLPFPLDVISFLDSLALGVVGTIRGEAMEIYFQLVSDAESLRKACRELAGDKALGFDVETTALDPYKGDLRLVQLSDGQNTKVIDLRPFSERGDLRTSAELQPLRDLLAS